MRNPVIYRYIFIAYIVLLILAAIITSSNFTNEIGIITGFAGLPFAIILYAIYVIIDNQAKMDHKIDSIIQKLHEEDDDE